MKYVTSYGLLLIGMLFLVIFATWFVGQNLTISIHAIAPVQIYIDCSDGNDSNTGTLPGQAWKSLKKANTAVLHPGDSLLFKRGCIWTGRLSAQWTGTTTAPITIGAYGSGALPIIQADATVSSSRVEITGNYQILENLDVKTINAPTDPNCQNQTIGYFVGFNFLGTSSYNIVRNSKASFNTIGFHVTDNSHHNKILNNEIFMNSVMNHLTQDNSPDLGAWGIDLRGDDTEIAYNYFHDNNGWCAYDFSIKPGNAIELYNADRSFIHHNKVVNDRVFSEVGHDSTHTSNDNVWAYNVHIGKERTSRFLVLHDANNAFGPVLRSKVYNNSVYLSGPTSTGIGGGESGTSVINNIIFVTGNATSTTGFVQSNNIFWDPSGTPQVKTLGPEDKKVDPKFVNATTGDLRLEPGSLAINSGIPVALGLQPVKDFDGVLVPQGTLVDRGAFEFGAVSTPSTSPTGQSSQIQLKLLLHGIGKGGDNSNPGSNGTLAPIHIQRQVTVALYDVANRLIFNKESIVTFQPVAGNFTGMLSADTIPPGFYSAKVYVPHYLRRTVEGLLSIDQGILDPTISIALVAGDSNDDNALSILDYNMVLDCFSDLNPPKNCTDPNKKLAADITDDGNVNQFDYNLFLRELSVQLGQ